MEKLLAVLRKINLPKDKYAIFGSGPICVRGLRHANHDLDVIVVPEVWEEYARKPGWTKKEHTGIDTYIEFEGKNIELWQTWGPGEWNIKRLIADAEIIGDLPFVKIEHVLKWKRLNGREKDQRDIKLIEEYLSTNT